MIIPLVGEHAWKARLDNVPAWQPPHRHTLIIAPHPDDETLGAGGLIAALRARGVEVTIAAVTDGENAYADNPPPAEVREREQADALARLGVGPDHIHRLRLPDSNISAYESRLVEQLAMLVSAEMHIVAPWRGDFHPDHEACGRAAEAVAKSKAVPLTSYFFWTWHRGTPELLDGLALARFPLAEQELRAKREALACHRSQLEHASGFPILPMNLLEPMHRPFEIFLPS